MDNVKNHLRIQRIAGIGLFLAMEIILQLLGNIIAFGPVNINLALIPIVMCAMIYGPIGGGILGLANGLIILLSPSTAAVFFPVSVIGTVIICLFKATIAGVVAGFLYRFLHKKNLLAAEIVTSLAVVILNSGLFACGALVFYQKLLQEHASSYANAYAFLFLGLIGWNFILEVGTTSVISPIVHSLLVKSKIIQVDKN